MKKNLNIIKINGIRGIIFAGFVVVCLFAGFVVFPGLVGMSLWNNVLAHYVSVPTIGIIQGVLLWGIVAATYFILRKESVVICMKAPQELSEDELKQVFADIKKQSENDPILQAMIKARENELKSKEQSLNYQSNPTKIVPEQTSAPKVETDEENVHKV